MAHKTALWLKLTLNATKLYRLLGYIIIMTFTKFVNVFILQWFFIRLTKHMKKDDKGNYTIIEKWSFQYWIVPLTGWWSNLIYLSKKPKFLYIS